MAEKEQPDSLLSKTLRILAYPVGVGLGLWTARTNISDAAYDQMKKFGAFKDPLKLIEDSGKKSGIDNSHKTDYDKIKAAKNAGEKFPSHIQTESGQKLEKVFLDGLVNNDAKKNEGLIDRVVEARKHSFEEIAARKKMLNLDTVGKEWKLMHRSQKQTAIINALTVGAVTLGAMLAAGNLKVFRNASFKKDEDQGPETPSR
jgi:hypothetical protein